MVDHVLQTENVGNDVVVTGVKEAIPVPMIPFTQVDEPVEDDEDELMTQPFEQTQAVEETQVEDTQPQIEATQPLETQPTVEATQIEETVPFTQVEETVPFDDPEPVITAEQQVETTQQLETIPEEPEEEEEGKPKWNKRTFEEAVKGGEDLFFRYETMDPNMPQFTHSGVWNGLSSLELENMDMFMTNLREQFLSIPISKEHGITMAHFEDESVRIVGWSISDSMINF